jgi:hypothetical protein
VLRSGNVQAGVWVCRAGLGECQCADNRQGGGKGGAGGEVPQIKAMAGARDAVVTATWCCVFTEVQSRVKNTIT